MSRTRQIVLAAAVVATVAAAIAVFRSPTQKADLVIAPVSGPAR